MRKLSQQKAGVLLSYVNLVVGTVIPFFYTPIMLDILGQSEYGLYSLSQSITGYLSLLSMGLGAAIIRYLTKYRMEGNVDATKRLLGLFFVLYSIVSCLVCVVSAGLAFFADVFFAEGLTAEEISKLRILILLLAGQVVFSMLMTTFTSLITAYERFVFIKVMAILGTIAIPIINLCVLYLGQGSVGMAVAALIFQGLCGLAYFLYCKIKLKIVPCFKKMPLDLLKELAGYCFFVLLSSLADLLYWSTDKVLIGATLGTAAVAVYNVGGVFTSIMQNMASAMSQVFTPRVMMMASQEDQSMEMISEMMIRVGRLLFYVVSFILAGYAVFGQRFIQYWAGDGYEKAYFVALLTMGPLAIPQIQSVAFSTLAAQNKHRFRAVMYVVIAAINVVSTWLILRHFGIIGAAVCTALAYLLGTGIILNIYYYRVIKLDVVSFWKNIAKISIVPVVMMLSGWFVYNRFIRSESLIVLILCAVVFSVIYWVLNWFVAMNSYEKNLFLDFVRKKA